MSLGVVGLFHKKPDSCRALTSTSESCVVDVSYCIKPNLEPVSAVACFERATVWSVQGNAGHVGRVSWGGSEC